MRFLLTALAIASVGTALPQAGGVCNSGSLQCCGSVQSATSLTSGNLVSNLVPVDMPGVTGSVGVDCEFVFKTEWLRNVCALRRSFAFRFAHEHPGSRQFCLYTATGLLQRRYIRGLFTFFTCVYLFSNLWCRELSLFHASRSMSIFSAEMVLGGIQTGKAILRS
jgi:hypothetical protein